LARRSSDGLLNHQNDPFNSSTPSRQRSVRASAGFLSDAASSHTGLFHQGAFSGAGNTADPHQQSQGKATSICFRLFSRAPLTRRPGSSRRSLSSRIGSARRRTGSRRSGSVRNRSVPPRSLIEDFTALFTAPVRCPPIHRRHGSCPGRVPHYHDFPPPPTG